MAATAIPQSQRFFQPGVVGILWLPVIASTTGVPTTAEVTAGTDLTREVDDWSGWTVSTAFIETKDASTVLRPQLAAGVTFEGSSLTFNGSKNGTDARTVFTRGVSGFIIIGDAGVATGKKADVYPVTVGAVAKLRNLDSTNFKVRVDFGITNVPFEDITMP